LDGSQGPLLQLRELGPEQFAPPPEGGGLVQERVWVPLPQEAEQALQLLHPPLTAQAGFASEQLALVPPPEPLQLQIRVVPQAVAPLSPATVPVEQVPPEPPQTPLTTQAGFASEQLAFVPPPEPLQLQLRVVPQPVWPLSPATVPAVQAPPTLLLQAPLTDAGGQAAMLTLATWLLSTRPRNLVQRSFVPVRAQRFLPVLLVMRRHTPKAVTS
jgi:hypothetical protein